MRSLSVILSLFLVAFLFGCAPKRVEEPVVSQAEMDAANAIERAEEAIALAELEGADVEEAKGLLEEAKEAFVLRDFALAITKADSARDLAEKALAEIMEAREEALESAEEEARIIPQNTYKVGTWEIDRDCLWNISKKDYIYGDPWQWKKIYRANTDQIDDPDLIYPNQVLTIPE